MVHWVSGVIYVVILCVAAVVDEQAKREIKELLMQYDRTLLVADPRRCEPKKYAAVPFLHKAVHAMLSALHTTAQQQRGMSLLADLRTSRLAAQYLPAAAAAVAVSFVNSMGSAVLP